MIKLTPVFIDFETYWSADHTLTKMNPIIYVMHPKTEIISCAIKIGNKPAAVKFGEEIDSALKEIDWKKSIVIGHNLSGFDAMILAWRYEINPAMWGCTLAMARPFHSKTTGLSLGKLVEHYNIGVKNNSALINTRGRYLTSFTPKEREAMKKYNKADVEQCAKLYKELLTRAPDREMQIIDMTIRMLVEFKFLVKTRLLEQTLTEEKQRKRDMLLKLARALNLDETTAT